MMAYESVLQLIAQLDDMVAAFEDHPDPTTRERAAVLLSGIDALHREGLVRLVERLREEGAGAALERASDDPVVRILLGLYDLAELPLPDEPEEAEATVGFVPRDQLTFRGRSEK